MSSCLLHGIFPVLKPKGVTSAVLLNKIKERAFNEIGKANSGVKMGHGGTLDSSATGVIAIGVGKGCKNLKIFLQSEKAYTVTGQLGRATETYNDNGNTVMEKSYAHVTEDMLLQKLKGFQGRIKQTPPLYSALKKDGRRYSDWANDGVEIELKPRIVHCYELSLIRFEPPYFTLRVSCGAGFYARSLVHDLGLEVGSCAHVSDLERSQHGPFGLKDALSEDRWTRSDIAQNIHKWKHKIQFHLRNYDKW